MRRREFFGFAAGGLSSTEPINDKLQIEDAIYNLEKSIRSELPDVKTIRVNFNPKDPRVPLMVMAFRF